MAHKDDQFLDHPFHYAFAFIIKHLIEYLIDYFSLASPLVVNILVFW